MLILWLVISTVLSPFPVEAKKYKVNDELTVRYGNKTETYRVVQSIHHSRLSIILKVNKIDPKTSENTTEVLGNSSSSSASGQDELYILKIASTKAQNRYIKNEFGAYIKLKATKLDDTRPVYLPKIFDMGKISKKVGHRHVLKMEVLEKDLSDYYSEERERLPAPICPLFLLGRMWTLVVEIHKQMVMHRDIKAINCMIRNGQAVLIDFGVSLYEGSPLYNFKMEPAGTEIFLPASLHGNPNPIPTKLLDIEMIVFSVAAVGLGNWLPWLEILEEESKEAEKLQRVIQSKNEFGEYLENNKVRPGLSRNMRKILKKMLDLARGDGVDLKRKYTEIAQMIYEEFGQLGVNGFQYNNNDYDDILDEIQNTTVPTNTSTLKSNSSKRRLFGGSKSSSIVGKI